jgi:predicted short-subunit dehydrogenase-like oxidoreductase (DUF2520 family)
MTRSCQPAQRLAQAVPLTGSVVFHCSGALASDRLQAVRAAGGAVASVHPIRSFADPQAVAQAFAGTYCGMEGDVARWPCSRRRCKR